MRLAAFAGSARLALPAVAAVAATLVGCVGNPVVVGNIPPTTFQFKTVVEHDGEGLGGWQVAQVLVLLGRLSMTFPRAATCAVEVGVPIVTWKGPVPVPWAQDQSAWAADNAARAMMEKREVPTAPACHQFRKTMQRFLAGARGNDGPIPGAKVGQFTRGDVPRRTFPPRRGR